MIGYIYSLSHPDTNEIFYIGSTCKSLEERLCGHMGAKKVNYEVYNYIRQENITPIISLIKKVNVDSKSALLTLERKMVLKYISNGCNLMNKQFNPEKMKNRGKIKTIKISSSVHHELKYFVAVNSKVITDFVDSAILKAIKDTGHELQFI